MSGIDTKEETLRESRTWLTKKGTTFVATDLERYTIKRFGCKDGISYYGGMSISDGTKAVYLDLDLDSVKTQNDTLTMLKTLSVEIQELYAVVASIQIDEDKEDGK